MVRRLFSRAFKLEAVRLVRERGASVVQACRDLDIGENVLRREVTKLNAARDILKKPWPTSRGSRYEVRPRGEAPRNLAGSVALRGTRCVAQWISQLADTPAQRSCTERRGADSKDTRQLCGIQPHLWRTSRLA